MELVYLWVEDYKNIHKQGFNFSPRFTCDYDEDKNELTIDENDDYIKNFFGKNINVTAIVGKNGSGKSSLLELLLILTFKSKDYLFDEKYGLWCIVFDNKIQKFKILTFSGSNFNFSYISSPYNIENIYLKQVSESSFFTIHYNFACERYSSSFINLINTHLQVYQGSLYDFDSKPLETSNAFSFPNKKYNKIDLDEIDNTAVLLMFKTLNENSKVREFFYDVFKTIKLNFIPVKITTQLNQEKLEKVFANNMIKEIACQEAKDLSLKNLYVFFINITMSYFDTGISEKKLTHYFLNDESTILKFIIIKYDELSRKYTRVTLENLVKEINDDINSLIDIIKNDSIWKQLNKKSESLNVSVYNLAKLIDSIRINRYNEDILLNSISDYNIIFNTVPYLPEFVQLNTIDQYNTAFSDYSYGEKNLIGFLYSLMYHVPFYARNISVDIVNILIDEIDSGLNPFWQKKLIKAINKLLKYIDIDNKMLNIVITTHSPFLLSDIPKQNIIFLDTYENGHCKVLNHDKVLEKKQTFGANIHTLLSDSFFMEDGLMGEFAKNKINEVIDNLQDKKDSLLKTQIKSIIDIIGEPFLQIKLEQMYNVKYELDNELEELQEQEEKIKNKISQLKKQKIADAQS